MISQLLALLVGSLLLAIGLVSLIGLRRLAEGVAILAVAVPLGLALFGGLGVALWLHGG
jgi:hypothetical protein